MDLNYPAFELLVLQMTPMAPSAPDRIRRRHRASHLVQNPVEKEVKAKEETTMLVCPRLAKVLIWTLTSWSRTTWQSSS